MADLTDVQIELAKINTKLDMFLTKQEDHEHRLRALEKAKWLIAGAAAAGAGSVSALISSFLG